MNSDTDSVDAGIEMNSNTESFDVGIDMCTPNNNCCRNIEFSRSKSWSDPNTNTIH
jgi:hypothetical protein